MYIYTYVIFAGSAPRIRRSASSSLLSSPTPVRGPAAFLLIPGRKGKRKEKEEEEEDEVYTTDLVSAAATR